MEFLEGRETELVDRLRARMDEAAAALRFEDAARLRDQLQAVERSLEKQRVAHGRPGRPRRRRAVARGAGARRSRSSPCGEGSCRTRAATRSASRSSRTTTSSRRSSSLYYEQNPAPDEVLVPLEPAASGRARRRARGAAREAGADPHPAARREGGPARGRDAQRRAGVQELAREGRAAREGARRARPRSLHLVAAAALDRVLRHLDLPGRARGRLGRLDEGRRARQGELPPLQGEERGGAGRLRHAVRGDHAAAAARARGGAVPGPPRHRRRQGAAQRGARGGEGPRRLDLARHGHPGRAVRGDGRPREEPARRSPAALGTARVVAPPGAAAPRAASAALADAAEARERGFVSELARSPERVFLPGRKDPVVLRQNSAELFLLARLRDEAHRFAITFHRKLRRERNFQQRARGDPRHRRGPQEGAPAALRLRCAG